MTCTCPPAAEAAGEPHHTTRPDGWTLEARLAKTAPADAVIFFASPDDSLSDDVAAALYGMARHGHLTMPIGVVHRASTPLDAIRRRLRDAMERGGPVDSGVVARVLGMVRSVDLQGVAISRRPVYHLALPPSELARVLDVLRRSGGAAGGRAILDKTFGRDLRTARALNHLVEQVFAEPDVFRIDHAIPDDRIDQLLSFRQSHAFVEPLWNRHHVESVQITMAESDGISDDGRYDRTGAVRDAVQSDLLHLLATVAMDLPAGADSDVIRNERARVLSAVRAAAPRDLLRGQYRGYHREPRVTPGSTAETFAALRLWIDSERWASVPFHLRTGKHLPTTVTEVVVRLRPPRTASRTPEAGYVRFRCAPTTAIEVVTPTFTRRPAEATVEYGTAEGPRASRSALEDMLTDAIRGNRARFARRAQIDDAWRIIGRLLDDESPVFAYDAGTWGPAPVNRAISPSGGWVNPTPLSRLSGSTLFRSAQPVRA